MGDEVPNAMNLDLNLGLIEHPSVDTERESSLFAYGAMNLEDWLGGPGSRGREAVMRRRQRWISVWRRLQASMEAREIESHLNDGVSLPVGEGSIAVEERPLAENKTRGGNEGVLNDELLRRKDHDVKGDADAGSFFDCSICLDIASDPVVTCCGHLFCWSCLYRWLHFHSDAKECPMCKGEVDLKSVTPIYGRGKSVPEPVDNTNLKIPPRPQAIRRCRFSLPTDEMIRRLGSRFDLSQDPSRESAERSNFPLTQILTSTVVRGEHNRVISPEDVFGPSILSDFANSQALENHQTPSLYFRRSNSNQAAAASHATDEALIDSYIQNEPLQRNREHDPAVDDRDSVSSVAAVIQSDSQTVDTTFEIDSRASLSTSSSRRRNSTSRISDVDSGDSRAPRRRRLI